MVGAVVAGIGDVEAAMVAEPARKKAGILPVDRRSGASVGGALGSAAGQADVEARQASRANQKTFNEIPPDGPRTIETLAAHRRERNRCREP